MKLRIAAVGLVAALAIAPLTPSAWAHPLPHAAHRAHAKAHTAYLVGNVLHRPHRRAIHVPFGYLLGHSPRGWVIGSSQYLLVDGTSVTKLGSRGGPETGERELLSSDAQSIVTSYPDRYGFDTQSATTSLDGVGQRLPDISEWATIVDAAGDRAYAVAPGGTGVTGIYELVAGAPADAAVRLTETPARLVDLTHDVAFIDPDDDPQTGTGPVPFSAILAGEDPTPPWQASCRGESCHRFSPTKISPDGRSVLGYRFTSDGDLTAQVRRMRDGQLLRTFSATSTGELYNPSTTGWDGPGSRALLQVIARDHGLRRPSTQYLRRCVIATGRCTRLTRTTTLPISISTAMTGPRTMP